jgi:hypothetical protein
MATTLKALLRGADPMLVEYVKSLERENSKLQKQIVALECNAVSSKNRVASLQKEVNKLVKKGHITVVLSDPTRRT